MNFYFDLVPPFYFLKWDRCFSTFISPNVNNLSNDYREKYARVYKLKKIPLMEFW